VVQVVNADWSIVYLTTLLGFDNLSPQGMIVDALPTAPGVGWVVRAPNYPTTSDPNDLYFWKIRHCYLSPQIPVASSAGTPNQFQFNVSAPNAAKILVGAVVRVHTFTYSEDSGLDVDFTVTDVTGTLVTLDGNVGFNIGPTHLLDLIGFLDGGDAYKVI
jgi:hypothetical protein